MEFKKTIAAFAITASSAFALMAPPERTKTVCIDVREAQDGALIAGHCDQSKNNVIKGLEILSNNCAEDQVALIAKKYKGQSRYDIDIRTCLPPGVVQL